MSTMNVNNSVSALAVGGVKQGELTRLANEFVNTVFYGSLMREFRQSHSSSLIDQGPGHQTFMQMLDTELVKRMGDKGQTDLSQAVVRQLTHKAERIRDLAVNAYDTIEVSNARMSNG